MAWPVLKPTLRRRLVAGRYTLTLARAGSSRTIKRAITLRMRPGGHGALIDLATASIRGLVMFGPVTDRRDLEQRWRAIRQELTHVGG